MPRKFYRTIVEVEVLSEEPFPDVTDLDAIHYMVTEGDCSGKVSIKETKEIDGKTAADLLKAQGSDPEFFMLTEDGNDVGE